MARGERIDCNKAEPGGPGNTESCRNCGRPIMSKYRGTKHSYQHRRGHVRIIPDPRKAST